MWQMRIIRYIPSNNSPMIFMNEERLPMQDIYIAPETYMHRKNLGFERFNNMLNYAVNESVCRSVILQNYFGDKASEPCGICDICLAKRRERNGATQLSNDILSALRNNPLSPREVTRQIKAEPTAIAETIDKLTAEGKISFTNEGKLLIIE